MTQQNGSRILTAWRAERERSRRPILVQMRGFDGARNDHITAGFLATNSAIDDDIRSASERLRGRSRNLAQNNDYMRKFLRMCEVNVVGPHGFVFKSLARDQVGATSTPDNAARDVIERHFGLWSRPGGGCDITRRHGFAGLCKLAIKGAAREGEYLIRKVRGAAARNPYNFALQLLDVDRLDVQRNGEWQGNAVIMGVEIDSYGAPVAYHLLTQHPGALSYVMPRGQRYERVPASDIFHGFIADRPEQRRGVPWAHTAMTRLEMLGKFQTAALVAARKGAETVGVLERSLDADVPEPGQPPIGERDPATGNTYEESLPGTWDTLPYGYSAKAFDSKYPDAVFGQFVKDALRGVASGLGVAYNGIANDLEGVNYSSIRAGVLEERDCWIELQNWMIEQLVGPAFHEWLSLALIAGAITFPAGAALPASRLEKFAEHRFIGRRWAWVDPDKDGAANERAVKRGWKTNEQVASEQGFDFHDNLEALAQEQAEAERLGVQLGDPPAPAPAPPAEPPQDPARMAELANQRACADALGAITLRTLEALRIEATRPIELRQEAPTIVNEIHVDPTPVTVHNDVRPSPTSVHNEVRVEPTPVTVRNEVQPTPVNLEATLPPLDIKLSLPDRVSKTQIERDASGRIKTSTTVEKDA
jgi:lambda family phage portal protein